MNLAVRNVSSGGSENPNWTPAASITRELLYAAQFRPLGGAPATRRNPAWFNYLEKQGALYTQRAPSSAVIPDIIGPPQVGVAVGFTHGVVYNGFLLSWRWQRNTSGSMVDIPGSTKADTVVPELADVGFAYRVAETWKNQFGQITITSGQETVIP
jgi:hypothetical protein